MLTANYDVLGLLPDDKILDLGCGFGRHAFEAARRGAHVVALDAGADEVAGVAATFAAFAISLRSFSPGSAGGIPPGPIGAPIKPTRTVRSTVSLFCKRPTATP